MRKVADHVYVARVGGWSKVGLTTNVTARMRRIARATGYDVVLVKSWRIGMRAEHVEAICIYGLRHKLAPLGRECFTIPADELVAAVEDAVRRVRSGERRLRPRERARRRYHERKTNPL